MWQNLINCVKFQGAEVHWCCWSSAGKGKHSRAKTSALKPAVENLLVELQGPFVSKEEDYRGFLFASGDSVRSWLMTPGIKQKLQLMWKSDNSIGASLGDQCFSWSMWILPGSALKQLSNRELSRSRRCTLSQGKILASTSWKNSVTCWLERIWPFKFPTFLFSMNP